MKRTISVMDAMTRTPVSLGPETILLDCAKKMIKEKVGSLVVLENNLLKGIITEKDLVNAMAQGLDKKKIPVKEVMTKQVITINPQMDLLEAIRLMSEKEVRRLPVVDKTNRIIGLLTVSDILKVEPQLLEIIFEKELILPKKIRTEDGECEICGAYTLLHSSKRKSVCSECD